MSVRNHRLVVTAIVTAAAVAVPAAALASGSRSPAKPVPSSVAAGKSAAVTAAGTSKAPSEFPALAASAGISVSRLQAGLIAAKRAGGGTAMGVAAFAAAAGVPNATAQRIVSAVFGNSVDRSMTGPVATTALATRLGVSTSAARRVLQQIDALNGKDGVNTDSAAFAAVAHGLGVSPGQLVAALDGVKRSLAGK
jgi:hypothetical protein